MSRVTAVVLTCHPWIDGNPYQAEIRHLNGRLTDFAPAYDDYQLRDLSNDGRAWGGSKSGPALWGGAFNHFPFREFARAVVETGWDYPEDVAVTVKFEERPWLLLGWAQLRAVAESDAVEDGEIAELVGAAR